MNNYPFGTTGEPREMIVRQLNMCGIEGND